MKIFFPLFLGALVNFTISSFLFAEAPIKVQSIGASQGAGTIRLQVTANYELWQLVHL
ncbi:MAG TPA: hypothetical protein VJK54_09290 [Chthoniobacterales bacterium]|nr:hypothetical protein [Chthoniobacterales bacterium]